MDLNLSDADLAFRGEVRALIHRTFPGGERYDRSPEHEKRWHAAMLERGWASNRWPAAFGGPGWTPTQSFIWERETSEADLPPQVGGMGMGMLAPVLFAYGSTEQQQRFLPDILHDRKRWCQGYSEPGAGSDLASLRTRAVLDGETYVVDGEKVWTSGAHQADWMFCLTRTSDEPKRQAGITFLLVDMQTPGIVVRPIISISGEHEVNQVFFENVRVPVENRVGPEDEGWTVAKYLLEFERGGSYAARLRSGLARIRKMAAETPVDGATLLDNRAFRRKLSDLEIQVTAVDFSERRVISSLGLGSNVGDATASTLKVCGSETSQKLTELALEILGDYAAPFQRPALTGEAAPVGPAFAVAPTAQYLNARASTIFGGSSEVQRNILSRAVLGL